MAALLAKGDDAILKKIGEEATETVLAGKDGDPARITAEVADLWFHCLVLLAAHGLGAGRRAGRAGAARGHVGPRGEVPARGRAYRQGPVSPYRHRQIGWKLIAGTVVGFAMAIGVTFVLSPATRAAAPWLLPALYGLLALGLALFSTLTVEVDAREIRVRFGVGLVQRTIPLADVVRCDPIRTKLWWGVGLRWTPAGWLYNIGGRDAVRLDLSQQRPVMIGSDDVPRLKAAIDAQLAHRAIASTTT